MRPIIELVKREKNYHTLQAPITQTIVPAMVNRSESASCSAPNANHSTKPKCSLFSITCVSVLFLGGGGGGGGNEFIPHTTRRIETDRVESI
jgi:hypothetical protein